MQWVQAEVVSTTGWSAASSTSRGHDGEQHRGDELGHDGEEQLQGGAEEMRGERGKESELTGKAQGGPSTT